MGLFGAGTGPGQPRYTGAFHNLQLTQSVAGTCAPLVFGTVRVAAKLLFYGGFYFTQQNGVAGGKGIFGGGGKGSAQYNYYADTLGLLAQGCARQSCVGVLNIWDQNGKLVNNSSTFPYTIPAGGGSVIPSSNPLPHIDTGVYQTVTETVNYNDYGSNTGVQSITTTHNIRLTGIPVHQGSPGAGQYTFDPVTKQYTFSSADAGKTVYATYSSVYSLYYIEQTQAAQIPLSDPYQVSPQNQNYYASDLGVTYVDTGLPCTSYSVYQGIYTFTSADAGRYVYINYEYTSSDPTITNSSALNLTVFTGAQSQAPWSYMQSRYPGSAFGYSALCYVGSNPLSLGTSGSTPSYNYELMGLCVYGGGLLDAHPCDALYLLLTDPVLNIDFPVLNLGDWSSAYAYWAANNYFISKAIDTQSAITEVMGAVFEAGNIGPVFSGGVLKLVPYGDTTVIGNGYTYTPPGPVAVLTVDDLQFGDQHETGQPSQSDPVIITQRAAQDCQNYVQAQYTNRLNDYNNEPIIEQNDAFIRTYGRRQEAPQTWDFLTSRAAASWALNLRLKRNCYMRNKYKFNLDWSHANLECMDLVVLPSGETVRITQIVDTPAGLLQLEAEQWTYGSANATLYDKQVITSYQPTASRAQPGNTSAYIFEATPQSVLAKPNCIQIAVAGSNTAWGGCDVYVSQDNVSYTRADTIRSQNCTGVLTAALGDVPDPDTSSTLQVDMRISQSELVAASQAEADNFVTLAAIVSPGGAVELISFETVTLTAANRYSLSYLRRGVYGTPISSHPVGSEFTYLGTSGIEEYQYPAQYVGRTLYFKFASFNTNGLMGQDYSTCAVYSFTVPGSTLQPPSTGVFSTVPLDVLTAFSNTTNGFIVVAPFIATLNNQSVSVNPNSYLSPPLAAGQAWQVYYVDLAFRGGNITPVFTQQSADYINRPGYYYLGMITTPAVTSGSGGGGGGASTPVYYPSRAVDNGSSTTTNPTAPWGQNPSVYATVSGSCIYVITYQQGGGHTGGYSSASGNYLVLGLPDTTPSGEHLYVTYSTAYQGSSALSFLIDVSWDAGSTWTNLLTSSNGSLSQTVSSTAVPSSTDLKSIQVRFQASVATPTNGDEQTQRASLLVYDIHVE